MVHGIAESEDEVLKEKLVDLSRNILEVDMKFSDIENIYRFGKSTDNTPRKLLVKFCSKLVRDKFYKNRKKTPIGLSNIGNIYINEDLTQLRSKLFHDTRQLVKRGRLHSTWTQFGNVMIKTTSDDKPVQVMNHTDLREKCTIHNQNITSDSDITDEDEI